MRNAIPNNQPRHTPSGRLTSADRRATAAPPPSPAPARAAAVSAPLATVPTGAQRDILLVEDDADTAAALQQMLGDEGHTVDLARGGAEGLHALQRGRYRLLLLDLMMPGVDGMQ